MKHNVFFLFLLVSMCILSAVNHDKLDKGFAGIQKQQTQMITIYTPVDIIYLEGKWVHTETGRIDLHFRTYNHAINYVEQLTADIANGQYE